ncbi:MAG: YbhB/YbcL family Raf kinase inhibitor-like protein [Deltaproteobacteria bacterium]
MKKWLSLFIMMAIVSIPIGLLGHPVQGATAKPKPVFTLTSAAFVNNGKIPTGYCNTGIKGGYNVSIPLAWTNPPAGTKSFALLMYDLHPIANNWVHWAVINIPAGSTALVKGCSLTAKLPKGSTELNNTFGTKGYGGPQPPARSGNHQYKIIIYALNTDKISVAASPTVNAFNQSVKGKILGQAELNGLFGI